MIGAFALDNARLVRIDETSQNLESAIWIDLIDPSSEERDILQQGLGQSLASYLELEDLEDFLALALQDAVSKVTALREQELAQTIFGK